METGSLFKILVFLNLSNVSPLTLLMPSGLQQMADLLLREPVILAILEILGGNANLEDLGLL